MPLRAGLGILLLALTSCAHRPNRIMIDLDGYRIEIGKKDGPNGQ